MFSGCFQPSCLKEFCQLLQDLVVAPSVPTLSQSCQSWTGCAWIGVWSVVADDKFPQCRTTDSDCCGWGGCRRFHEKGNLTLFEACRTTWWTCRPLLPRLPPCCCWLSVLTLYSSSLLLTTPSINMSPWLCPANNFFVHQPADGLVDSLFFFFFLTKGSFVSQSYKEGLVFSCL